MKTILCWVNIWVIMWRFIDFVTQDITPHTDFILFPIDIIYSLNVWYFNPQKWIKVKKKSFIRKFINFVFDFHVFLLSAHTHFVITLYLL